MPHRHPRPDFDTLAHDYAKFRTSYSPSLFDAIEAYARLPAGAQVLDLACGTGLGMREYVRRGYAVWGIDIAPAMIAQARQKLMPGEQVELAVGCAESLPFPDASFDLVSCAQAFHWFEPNAAFAQCARVLRPGGCLAVFWKHAAPTDPLTAACEALVREWLGEEAMHRSRDHAAEHESGWPLFRQYAALIGEPARGRLFVDGRREVIEYVLPRTAAEFVGFQRSREKLRSVLGGRREEFLMELARRLAHLSKVDQPIEQRLIQYLFLARKEIKSVGFE
jgi:SAM-dependent methyltransferase